MSRMTMGTAPLALLTLVMMAGAQNARAADPKRDDLTLQPFTGARITLGERSNRMMAGFAFVQQGGATDGLRMDLSASTPLDPDTRQAAFLKPDSALINGFSFELFIGYDSRVSALALDPSDAVNLIPLCERYEVDGVCTWEAIKPQVTTAVLRSLTPSTDGVFFLFGLDLSATYDQTEVYRRADSADAILGHAYDLEAGVRADLTFAPWLQLSLRSGLEAHMTVKTKSVQRCSGGGGLAGLAGLAGGAAEGALGGLGALGTSCETIAILDGPLEPVVAGYIRVGATVIIPHIIKDLTPGFELRVGLEELGNDPEASPYADIRFSAFVTPVIAPLSIQIGVGVDLMIGLEDEGAFEAGEIRGFTPFGVLGGEFGTLGN